MNKIVIDTPLVKNNIIYYNYKITGKWIEAFHEEEQFTIEYGCDIGNVPTGVLIIPLLANLLPIAWIYDAEICAPVCDSDFYDCIPNVKKGYINMYPMMKFGGRIIIDEIQNNEPEFQAGSICFFSGGVDSFCTLIRHKSDHPSLITLWGSDVSLNDTVGWEKVCSHLDEVSEIFNVSNVVIKSKFRRFLNEGFLHRKVRISGDGWWHGFQHGIGIISHAAPVMYVMNKKTIYFASTYTASDKGVVTCASDPTIDNELHFCGVNVFHDGYDLNRQDKIHVITEYSKDNNIGLPLRVCWESKGGSNCCHCEKCWRTILGLYAAGCDPKTFGFHYASLTEIGKEIKNKRNVLGNHKEAWYSPIWNEIRQNYTKRTIDPGLRWFYNSKFEELETGTKYERGSHKARRFAEKVKWKVKRMLKI